MLQVNLEADNIDLIGLTDSKINLLLRYGKITDNAVTKATIATIATKTNNINTDNTIITKPDKITVNNNLLDTNKVNNTIIIDTKSRESDDKLIKSIVDGIKNNSVTNNSVSKDDIKTFVSNIISTIEAVEKNINNKNNTANNSNEAITKLDNNIRSQIEVLETLIKHRSNTVNITKDELDKFELRFKNDVSDTKNKILFNNSNNTKVINDNNIAIGKEIITGINNVKESLNINISKAIEHLHKDITNLSSSSDTKITNAITVLEHKVIKEINTSKSELLASENKIIKEIDTTKSQVTAFENKTNAIIVASTNNITSAINKTKTCVTSSETNTKTVILQSEQKVTDEIKSLKLQIANDIGVKGLVAKFESFENFKQDIKRDITDFRTEFKNIFAKNKGKGDLCEITVMKYLHDNIMNYEIVDQSANPNMGDISISSIKGYFCIECKNYSSNVPTREVDKFVYALDINKYDAGIILNYDYGICNMDTLCELRFTPKKKPYFVLSKFNSNKTHLLLSITMLEKWKFMYSNLQKIREDLKVEDIQLKLQTANNSLKIVNDSRLETIKLLTEFINTKVKELQTFMEMIIKINNRCTFI